MSRFLCPPVKGGAIPDLVGGGGGFYFCENQTPRSPSAHAPLHRGAKNQ